MPKREKIVLDWTGGMESAIALFELKSPDYTLRNFVASVELPTQRHPMTGIRRSMVQKQAESLQSTILFVPVPENPSNEVYESAVREVLQPMKKKGLDGVAFTDVQIEEMRAYREQLLSPLDLKAVEPLWAWDEREVLRVFFSLGYRAIVTSINTKKLPLPFLGREYDRDFIDSLPSGVSPFGERGEFSTFVYDGPFFQSKVTFKRGQIFERSGFAFLDIE